MLDSKYIAQCEQWLLEQFEGLTDTLVILDPSKWAEKKRYLPPQVTPMPGFYSFDVAPYLREILDCFSPHSPIREVSVMKGVQICFTVGVLENVIGYYIDHIKNAPMMLVTADAELAQLRMESYIIPMINASGLGHLIKSADENNKRKTGKTDKKIEFVGGGFLVPFGAQNANKLRSISIQVSLQDEIDGWPDVVGKDGDPGQLSDDRTAAYESSRKILRGSTPLITQTSKILKAYKKGDQRKYLVPCRHCNTKQELVFHGVDKDTGAIYGVDFSVDDAGNLIEESVVYICKHCQGEMTNDDKVWMLPRGEWTPTAETTDPTHRSYHISALYSPVGMQTWATLVRKWLDCWDVKIDKVKDMDGLQRFYNNVLGEPFEMRGVALRFERVVTHRRVTYHQGMVPNVLAEKETGGKIQLLTCAVDVHKAHLDLQVIGWCNGGTFYSIDYMKLEGDCEDLNSEPWQKVRDLLRERVYTSDDGRQYRIQLTLLDSQYNQNIVLDFCSAYSAGVFPIRGTELPKKGSRIREFSEFDTKLGTRGYNITTTIYKDKLSAAMNREWSGQGFQPDGHPNFPMEYPDQFFKEFTKETKREKIEEKTGRSLGWSWVGRDAHAWDLTVYNSAALDIIALNVCMLQLDLEYVNRKAFFDLCESKGLFWV